MPESQLKFFKHCAEILPKKERTLVPKKRRGLYVLYDQHRSNGREMYDVVYIGMTTSGFGGRLRSHEKHKGDLWTHFSVFEVWDNIRDDEIAELEGLFRHLYRRDARANNLNIQRAFKKMKKIRNNNFKKWI